MDGRTRKSPPSWDNAGKVGTLAYPILGWRNLDRPDRKTLPGRADAHGTRGKVKQIVDKTTQEKPAAATHWSTRTMAAAVGISEATVRRIWHAHGLKPHLRGDFQDQQRSRSSPRNWKTSSGCI